MSRVSSKPFSSVGVFDSKMLAEQASIVYSGVDGRRPMVFEPVEASTKRTIGKGKRKRTVGGWAIRRVM